MPRTIFRKFAVLSFLFLLVIPLLVQAGHCSVSGVTVVAGPWENTQTKTSLTLQTQDVGGVSCHVGQTLRFSLESSNASGVFTGQSGGALQYYVSSGSANRNFYYENGDATSFSLTAKAGYGAASDWTESFSTTYESSNAGTPDTASSNSSSTTNSNGGSSSQASSVSPTSAHYGASELSDQKVEPAISMSAGRDRLGAVGSPLEFRAETNFDYTRNGSFTWNFGDGTEGDGEILNHVYEYPGEYAVVLNAAFPAGRATSRINVKIIDPEIVIVSANFEKIEIKNNSKQEVSLYGRALWVYGNIFTFPQDTIVKAGQSISFGSKVTRLHPNAISEVAIVVVGNTENSKLEAVVEEWRTERVVYLQNQISLLSQQLFGLRTPHLAAEPPSVIESEAVSTTTENSVFSLTSESQMQTASARNGWFQVFKRFLLRTQ